MAVRQEKLMMSLLWAAWLAPYGSQGSFQGPGPHTLSKSWQIQSQLCLQFFRCGCGGILQGRSLRQQWQAQAARQISEQFSFS
jgi:hypothetical protein